ncbi:sure-like protein [Sistotremastrum niveocremeum HHB9708]|uniref:Sure-like protein n=1 Tax=Sistotremastrum niveocremeum HHB9708 TaxID=1314777 RepID=A0A164U6K8_9AGAM|nr:sure-like protein [Sistotremastrum niveocremeum HHB9708]
MYNSRPPTVLLTNDDGPPGPESPYIYGFSRQLKEATGWNIKVVVPSSQKSWIGKSFQIKEVTQGQYYYPRGPDGLGETSSAARPFRDGESEEWILLDSTPATCVNIALYNLFPGEIDLVVSGPNLGRNTSAAFALSSGTIGASLSAALCHVRSIAVSYGTVQRPTPKELFIPAYVLSTQIVQKLWNNWGKDEGGLRDGEVDLYNVNLPMVPKLLSEEGMDICWTRIWRNEYGQLFRAPKGQRTQEHVSEAGPDSDKATQTDQPSSSRSLTFVFAPDFKRLITPEQGSLPEGSDAWALSHNLASVTPLRASFAEPSDASLALQDEYEDKLVAGRMWNKL